MSRLLAAALSAVLTLACSNPGEAPPHVVRDSAGVRIVESNHAAWTRATGWRIGTATLRIGVLEGDPNYQFASIEGAVRLDDGSLVVADGASQQLRFYDAAGRFRVAAGGTGAGPGEFTALVAIGRDGAGVWAYDFALRRVTWFDASGERVALAALGAEPPVLGAVGALPDGSFVLRQLWGAQRVAEATRTGLRRDTIVIVRFDRTGTLIDTIGAFPGREVVLTEENGRGVMTMPLFAHNSVAAIAGEFVLVAATDRFEIDAYTPDGTRRLSLRLMRDDLTLRPTDIARAIEQRAAAVRAEERARLRASLAAQPHPASRPAHGPIVPDRAGNLWVAAWAASPALPERWTVISADGAWLGDVEMPHGFLPHDIGENWMIGVERDELDVESLVLYPLLKPQIR